MTQLQRILSFVSKKTTQNKEQKLHGKVSIANSERKDMLLNTDVACKENQASNLKIKKTAFILLS